MADVCSKNGCEREAFSSVIVGVPLYYGCFEHYTSMLAQLGVEPYASEHRKSTALESNRTDS